jgi:hypothetical protein
MDENRAHGIPRLERLIAGGDTDAVYQALRASFGLRPVPVQIIDAMVRRRAELWRADAGGGQQFAQQARALADVFSRPSARALDPDSAIGAAAAAIRQAVPDHQEWTLDAGAAAADLLTFTSDRGERVRRLLPPGFAEGRPGAFVRASRGLLLTDDDGSVRTTYQLLQDSADQESFKAGLRKARLSDVLDFAWMAADPLELRSVEELLAGICMAVVPGAAVRFAPDDEPRYRLALRLHLEDEVTPAAAGGVLAEWPGRPPGVDAGHVRFFLEPWATIRSGEPVAFEELPPVRAARDR